MKQFLKKLFGKKQASNFDEYLPKQIDPEDLHLDTILQGENKTQIVIEIGQLLWEKSKDDTNFESLNAVEQNVLFIEMLEGQVNNGGFEQYFFNSSGEYANETLYALKEINAPKMAELVNLAINAFPELPIPKDLEQRRESMERIPKKTSQTWEKLDDEFYTYPEDLEELIVQYIKDNKSQFG